MRHCYEWLIEEDVCNMLFNQMQEIYYYHYCLILFVSVRWQCVIIVINMKYLNKINFLEKILFISCLKAVKTKMAFKNIGIDFLPSTRFFKKNYISKYKPSSTHIPIFSFLDVLSKIQIEIKSKAQKPIQPFWLSAGFRMRF